MTSAILPAGAPHTRVFGEPHLLTDGDLLLLTFGPDGSLWSLEEPGVLRHWTATGKPLETHYLSDLETLWCFSRDARFLASGSDDLTLWDASSGNVLTALSQESWLTALALGHDSTLLATGHDDGSVHCWDLTGHSTLHTFRNHSTGISAVAFSSDGKLLASAGEDRVISIWEVATGKLVGTLLGHTDRIPALAWHPRRPVLVSAGWDTTARVWDAVKLEPMILLNSHGAQVTALAFSPSGKLLACGDSNFKATVWDFDHKKALQTLSGPTAEIRSLAFAPDDTTLAGTGDRIIHLWNAATGQSLSGAGRRSQARPSVAVSPDGTRIASNGGGRAGQVWDVASGKPLWPLSDGEELQQVAWSRDGRWIAAAALEHVRIWNAATGALHKDCTDREAPVTAVTFTPDGNTLAAGSKLGFAVWLWDVASAEPTLIIPDPLQECGVSALAFAPDGKLLAVGGIDYLATGGSSGALSLWDIAERAEVATLTEGTTALAWHPGGKRIAATTLDHSIGLYDTKELSLVHEYLGHDDVIGCLAFSPDGKLLASGSDDQTMRLWDEHGDEVAMLEVDSRVTDLSFSADGKYLFAAHANTTCTQYAVSDLVKR